MEVPALVSVVVPCYNEEQTIGLLLNALYQQTYPRTRMEVILADGQSTDRTREAINRFQESHSDLKVLVVDNPKRIIPAGINAAIKAAGGEYIVRLDAHSEPDLNYVERSVDGLQQGKGDNVGGLWIIQPGKPGWLAQSIAAAAGHPLGAGDARYRYSTTAGEVDTVPFGAYHRSLFDKVGYFDESLLTNEDYEFNARIRSNGGKIFFDPAIRTRYFARSTLGALARQYWRYGFWKWRMLKRFPSTLRWRQAIPPLFVLGLFLAAVLSFWLPIARTLLAVVIGVYLVILLIASIPIALKKKDVRLMAGFPAAIATMHFSWGSSFLVSMLQFNGK